MKTHIPSVAASPTVSERDPQLAIGRGAAASQPFGEAPVDYPVRQRFVRPAPPELLARVKADDAALNAPRPVKSPIPAWVILGLGVWLAVFALAWFANHFIGAAIARMFS